jgi:hypothetical protein
MGGGAVGVTEDAARALARELVQRASSAVGVAVADVFGRKRTERLVLARSAVWFVMNRYHGVTLTTIGAAFNRDHSTISHGVTRVARAVTVDEETSGIVSVIRFRGAEPLVLVQRRLLQRLDDARNVTRDLERLAIEVEQRIKAEDENGEHVHEVTVPRGGGDARCVVCGHRVRVAFR